MAPFSYCRTCNGSGLLQQRYQHYVAPQHHGGGSGRPAAPNSAIGAAEMDLRLDMNLAAQNGEWLQQSAIGWNPAVPPLGKTTLGMPNVMNAQWIQPGVPMVHLDGISDEEFWAGLNQVDWQPPAEPIQNVYIDILSPVPSTGHVPPQPCSVPEGSPVHSTLSPATTAASSPSPGDHKPSLKYPCLVEGCKKSFARLTQLKQHQKTHSPAETCPHCVRKPFADRKGLKRHMYSKHRRQAIAAFGLPQTRACTFPDCDYVSDRGDNVSRHHRKIHGRDLRWREGVATMA